MPNCSACGSEYPAESETCPECGGSALTRCDRCGTEFAASDACPACGKLYAEVACAAHPDRSASARCVICDAAVCGECRTEKGGVALCPDHGGIPIIQGWGQVYSTASEFEAQLLQENLRSEGIDAQIFSQKDHIYTVDLGELSIVRVLVPVWEYGGALGIIREHMDTEGEVVFACPSCGEAYEPGSHECLACGASLVA